MTEELVVVATSNDILEADFLKKQLEAEGFEVFVADENIVGIYNWQANAVGGVKIKVPADQAEEARKLIDDLRNAEIIYDENFPEK